MARRVKAVWLDVTETFVEAAPAGEPARAVREWLEPAENELAGRASLADAIGACLERLGASGARVHALWRRDGATPLVVQSAATGRAARDAAVLSLVGTGEADPTDQSIGSTVIGVSNAGETSVLVSAVDAEILGEFERAVREAGGKPGTVIAGDAPGAIAAAEDAANVPGDDPAASLVLGEHQSAIAVRTGGALRLCRFIDVGASTLREAYARSLRANGVEGAEASEQADRLLFRSLGVPAPSDGARERIDASEVLRTMQPVLQRIGVELKQSIRFTLTDDERLRVRLRLAGPGRSISTLESILAEQVEGEPAPGENEATGWIELALACGVDGWKPASPGEAIGGGGDRRAPALYAGTAAAVGLLALGGFAAQRAADELDAQASGLARSLEAHETSTGTEAQRRMTRRLGDVRRVISAEVGAGTNFGAALALLAEAAAGEAIVESLSGRRDEQGSALDLRLEAAGESPEAARGALQRTIERLGASPLTAGVTVGSMQIRDLEGGGAAASGRASVTLHERAPEWLRRGASDE